MLPANTLAPAPSRVIQLSLWMPPASPWHAELAEPGAPARGFDSPFELARFLAQGAPGMTQREGSASPADGTSAADPAIPADLPAAAGLR